MTKKFWILGNGPKSFVLFERVGGVIGPCSRQDALQSSSNVVATAKSLIKVMAEISDDYTVSLRVPVELRGRQDLRDLSAREKEEVHREFR